MILAFDMLSVVISLIQRNTFDPANAVKCVFLKKHRPPPPPMEVFILPLITLRI